MFKAEITLEKFICFFLPGSILIFGTLFLIVPSYEVLKNYYLVSTFLRQVGFSNIIAFFKENMFFTGAVLITSSICASMIINHACDQIIACIYIKEEKNCRKKIKCVNCIHKNTNVGDTTPRTSLTKKQLVRIIWSVLYWPTKSGRMHDPRISQMENYLSSKTRNWEFKKMLKTVVITKDHYISTCHERIALHEHLVSFLRVHSDATRTLIEKSLLGLTFSTSIALATFQIQVVGMSLLVTYLTLLLSRSHNFMIPLFFLFTIIVILLARLLYNSRFSLENKRAYFADFAITLFVIILYIYTVYLLRNNYSHSSQMYLFIIYLSIVNFFIWCLTLLFVRSSSRQYISFISFVTNTAYAVFRRDQAIKK